MGVRLKLSPKSQDVYYVPAPGNPNLIYVSSKALDTFGAQNPECSGVNRSNTISRAKPGDDNGGTPWTESELQQQGTKVGIYYYIDGSGQPCSGDDQQHVDQLLNQVEPLRQELPQASDVQLG